MRIINTDEIINNIKEMCIEANHYLAPDILNVFNNARKMKKISSWKSDFRTVR